MDSAGEFRPFGISAHNCENIPLRYPDVAGIVAFWGGGDEKFLFAGSAVVGGFQASAIFIF